jgi:LPS-assembly lipoprotein
MVCLTRRWLGLIMGAGALQGCGLHPVYAPTEAAAAGAAERGLAETEVALIPERNGQLLREALRARFERGQSGTARRYDLLVSLGLSGEAIAIQRDNTTSRVRLVGTASWTLFAQSPQRSALASGFAREVDAYNILNQQFFSADLESESVQRRMMDGLAEKVTLQLATWFRRNAAG